MAMKIRDKYPTLAQSKRIAELLGKSAPRSQWYWEQSMYTKQGDITDGVWRLLEKTKSWIDNYGIAELIPAYDLAELGEMIVKLNVDRGSCTIGAVYNLSYQVWDGYVNGDYGDSAFNNHPTETQARAALLIHLLESKEQ